MTHLDLARVEERETGQKREPAKQWRNKWLAKRQSGGICDDGRGGSCGRWHELRPGDELLTCIGWETRLEAEQVAATTLIIRDDVAYLGPIRVEVSP